MENLIRQLIGDFQESVLPPLVPRAARVPALAGVANVVTGARRCGKTYFLYQQISHLLEAGIPKQQVRYINSEDERSGSRTAGASAGNRRPA